MHKNNRYQKLAHIFLFVSPGTESVEIVQAVEARWSNDNGLDRSTYHPFKRYPASTPEPIFMILLTLNLEIPK